MTFGEKLKDARKLKELTQRQLAEAIGAKHNSVSDWENDKNKPDPDSIELICGILELTPNYLLNVEESNDFSPFECEMIKSYRILDSHGKEMVDMVLDIEHKRCVSECKKTTSLESNVTAFKKEDSEPLKLNAAHSLPNATEEEIQHDEDIMNDENF